MAYLCPYKTVSELCGAACANQGSSGIGGCLYSCNTQATLQTVLDNCSVYAPSNTVDTVFVPVAPGVCDSLTVMSPAVIDSLNRFFVDGLAGGVSFAFPMLFSLFAILLVTYLLVSAVNNS
jgi:hypothetical protein